MDETAPPAAPESNASWKTWLRGVVLALIVAGPVAFYALGLHEYFAWSELRSNLDKVEQGVKENLLVALILFFLIYMLMAALSVPIAWMMTVAAGALFGRFLGGGVAVTAATCGATLAFLSSRFLLRDWVQNRFGRYLETLDRGIEKDGAFYLFSLRLVPFVPFFVLNLGMGMTPIRAWTYFWVSLIGMLPGSLLYANAGQSLAGLQSPRDILTWEVIVSFVLLGVAPLIFRKALAWVKRTD
jgi:uncharacterized membrane protein YdjX (TVP38/TMEM64 family)